MNERIKEQILEIRATGKTNMFDIEMVKKLADDFGYNDLILYLNDNKAGYIQFIMRGKE